MVKLRLKRMGSKYNAFYRIVATDSRSPRDGKYIEELGYYNPHTKEIKIDNQIKDKWLANGAIPSETVKKLFSKLAKLNAKNNEVIKLPKKVKNVKVTKPIIAKEVKSDSVSSEKDNVVAKDSNENATVENKETIQKQKTVAKETKDK